MSPCGRDHIMWELFPAPGDCLHLVLGLGPCPLPQPTLPGNGEQDAREQLPMRVCVCVWCVSCSYLTPFWG